MQISTISIDGAIVAHAETRAVQRLLEMATAAPGQVRSVHHTCKRPDTVWQDGKIIRATDPVDVTLNLVFSNPRPSDETPAVPPSQWIPLTPAVLATLPDSAPVWLRTKHGETWLMEWAARDKRFDCLGGMEWPDKITHIQLIVRPEAP